MAAIDVDENDNDSEEEESDKNISPAMVRMPRNIVLEMTDVEMDWGIADSDVDVVHGVEPHSSLTQELDLPPPWEVGSTSNVARFESLKTQSKREKSRTPGRAQTHSEQKEVNRFSLVHDGMQIFPAVIISCVGFVGSGYVLDTTQHWPVFAEISLFYIAIPMLLGLKGNLDMTLASRLSTASHMGILQDPQRQRQIIISSLALVQVQAIVSTIITAAISLLFGLVSKGDMIDGSKVLILLSSALLTMSVSALLLGISTCVLIVCSLHFSIDPDNIATPIVSSLGDFITMIFLAIFASGMKDLTIGDNGTAAPSILLIVSHFILFLVCYRVAAADELCKPILRSGWPPIVLGLGISQIAGMILEQNVQDYEGIAVLVPFINGVGGSMGAIFASRLCSSMHMNKTEDFKTISVTLLTGNIVLQGAFLLLVHFGGLGHVLMEWEIVSLYMVSSTAQVFFVLLFTRWLVALLYQRHIDPDNYAIPILTAIADVIGTGLLVFSFSLVY